MAEKANIEESKSLNKFAEILSRSNASIRTDRAKRISDAVSDAQDKLIMDINADIRKQENELDAMMDLSSSNLRTSLNVIDPAFSADDFIRKVQELKVGIELKKQELKIAKETKSDLF